MPVKEGKAVLRVSLDEGLIKRLKISAVEAGVDPYVIVDAALRSYLEDRRNLETLKGDR